MSSSVVGQEAVIKHVRGLAANWTTTSYILSSGEIGVEEDTGRFKLGDGASLYPALDYFIPTADILALLGDYVLLEDLGTAAYAETTDFDTFGSAASAQAFAIQRGNHTGSQAKSTVTGLVQDLSDLNTNKINVSEKGVALGVVPLDGGGKISTQYLPSSVMEYQGVWNASTNTPALANGTGSAGDVYLTSTPGVADFGAGPITFALGDWAVYDGSTWQRSKNSDAVVSVAGKTGIVTLNGTDIQFTPVGDISATTVAAALAELDSEKVAASGTASAGRIPTYTDGTGKIIQSSGRNFSVDGTLASNSDNLVPTERAVKTYTDGTGNAKISKSTLSAKGSLISATAASTPIDVPVSGTDGRVLIEDAASAGGIKWSNTLPFLTTAAQQDAPATRTSAVTLSIGNSAFLNNCDTTASAYNITLPNTTVAGHKYRIVLVAGTNTLGVVATTSVGIGQGTSVALTVPGDYVDVESTTTSGVWAVVGGWRINTARAGNRVVGVGNRTANFSLGVGTAEINNVDASTGPITATLASTTSISGISFTITKTDASVNLVTVGVSSSGTIDGLSTASLAYPGDAITVQQTSTAGVWRTVSRFYGKALSTPLTWIASTYYPAFQYVVLPTGGVGYSTTAITSGATFDATERARWTFIPGNHSELLTGSSGNWVCPTGISVLPILELLGGGAGGNGGGSASAIANQVGGPGGSPGEKRTFRNIPVVAATSYAYFTGSAGTGGTGAASGGAAGGLGVSGGDSAITIAGTQYRGLGGTRGGQALANSSATVGASFPGQSWANTNAALPGQGGSSSATFGYPCSPLNGVLGGGGGAPAAAGLGGLGGNGRTTINGVPGAVSPGGSATANGGNGSAATFPGCGGGGGGGGAVNGTGGNGADGFRGEILIQF